MRQYVAGLMLRQIALLLAFVTALSAYSQPFAEAQGGALSATALGAAALVANPAGMSSGMSTWEIALPEFSATVGGITLREYAFYFGGVRTPTGWQRRRLTLEEREEFVRLLESRPHTFSLRAGTLAGVWRPSPSYAVGFGSRTELWLRIQLPRGTAEAAQQPIIGSDTAELLGGTLSLRAYSVLTAAYARVLWQAGTAQGWRPRRFLGGAALHLYRGHEYVEVLPGGRIRLEPFMPESWDSTLSWDISIQQRWRLGTSSSAVLPLLIGAAPAIGWGAGVSIGLRWEWQTADTVPPQVAAAVSLEHAGFLRWSLTEAVLQRSRDTLSGILGEEEELQRRYTPLKEASTVVERMPARLRIGAAAEMGALGVELPLRLAVEYAHGLGPAWSLPGPSTGLGLVYQGPPWMPQIAVGLMWSHALGLQVPLGLQWTSPQFWGVRTVVEAATNSLLGWLLRGTIRNVHAGMCVRIMRPAAP